jgi:hypothetical protein
LNHGRPVDHTVPQRACDLCIKSLTTPSPNIPTASKADVTAPKFSDPAKGSNLNQFSPVESLLALSNQVTMSQMDKDKTKNSSTNSHNEYVASTAPQPISSIHAGSLKAESSPDSSFKNGLTAVAPLKINGLPAEGMLVL